ncbi:UTP--glucose-1-phosphate uridylyltransferase-like isoform X2 [Vigna unguiculata]|uniref:UTP--glucose-1-phosphate uridylyltransferase-like isoform X2 n=1 Tax=Vigna unguiculata TaxID=3917 RepID=UPI001016ACA9|nr:UTP--glucose-1-phosphate uridylyltransferase-like isoform X2 [Vigna unguiculata]
MTIHSIVIQKLLSTNAQVGRRVAAHHFKGYTYGFRNKMAIIDSDKTLICMRSAFNFIASLARHNARFMFINTNPLFDDIFQLMTKKVGSYSTSTSSLWRTGGFLTNSYSPKKFRSRNKKLVFGPTQPPDCIVIVDTDRKSTVINEAFKLQIPVVALVDSAMPLDVYSRIAYPVPANDSVQFVYLFCNLITKTLLHEKSAAAAAAANLIIDSREEAPRKGKSKSDLDNVDIIVVSNDSLAPLPEDTEETRKLLDKFVVLKFNGAQGRNMDPDGPKSAINISDGQTFLDMIINQIEMLNSKYGCRVPLLLFDKNDIRDSSLKVLEKYSKSSVEVHTLKPGESGELKLSGEHSSKEEMHPFDDVEVFRSLMTGGTIDSLLSQGKEYILVLKSDNVATIVDPNILNHLMINDIEYCMEVTPNQSFNLILPTMKFKLGEIARNQDKNNDVLKLKNNFKLIDTTNMWVSLRAMKRFLDADELKQEKPSIFKFFDNVIGVSVPQSGFFPLDATSDLLLLQSDLYTCREGVLTRNPARTNHLNPVIDLGPEFEKVGDFQSRFKSIPSIIELDSLRVRGDVWFGTNITLKGRVTISAKPGLKLEIPDGVTIENKPD